MRSSDARKYYVITARGEHGPVDRSEIKALCEAKEIAQDDRVRSAFGKSLGSVAELLEGRMGDGASSGRRSVRPSDRARAAQLDQALVADTEEPAPSHSPSLSTVITVGVIATILLAVVGISLVGRGGPGLSEQSSRSGSSTSQPISIAQPANIPDSKPVLTQDPPATIAPVLSLALNAATQNLDLSAAGSLDWMHPGENVRKDGKAMLRAEFIRGGPRPYRDAPVTCSWMDGSPITRGDDVHSAVFIAGDGGGFAISAPAGPQESVLHIRLGVWNTTCDVQATLSDMSMPPQSLTLDKFRSTRYLDAVITFRSVTPGQSVRVSWLQHGTTGNVNFVGAALSVRKVGEKVPVKSP